VNADRVVQGLFAIQLTLLGILLTVAGSSEIGVLCGGIGVLIGLVSLAGQPPKA
jgi:hypothetical protein